MIKINGFTEADIISSLRLSAITAMDEGSLSENEYGGRVVNIWMSWKAD